MDDRLYRSTTDRSLAGVCGGLAAWLGMDPSIVRIVWVLLALVSGGIFVIVYIVMAVVVPEAPAGWSPRGRIQRPGQPADWTSASGQGWGGSAPGGAWTGAPGWQQGGAPTGAPPADAQRQGEGLPPGQPTAWPADWDRAPRAPSGASPERAGIVAGVVLIVLGVWFLVGTYIPINWDLVWPIVVIALGALLVVGAMRRGR